MALCCFASGIVSIAGVWLTPVVGMSQASSSVAQDALSDDDRDFSVISSTTETASGVSASNAWAKKGALPNGMPDAWSDKDAPAVAVRSAKHITEAVAARAEQQQHAEKKAPVTGKANKQSAASKKEPDAAVSNGFQSKAATVVHANGTAQANGDPAPAPPPVQQKAPPISWRKILAGELELHYSTALLNNSHD
jgi:hypothetical protein